MVRSSFIRPAQIALLALIIVASPRIAKAAKSLIGVEVSLAAAQGALASPPLPSLSVDKKWHLSPGGIVLARAVHEVG